MPFLLLLYTVGSSHSVENFNLKLLELFIFLFEAKTRNYVFLLLIFILNFELFPSSFLFRLELLSFQRTTKLFWPALVLPAKFDIHEYLSI